MRNPLHAVFLSLATFTAVQAQAQVVPGNQALRASTNGIRASLPPLPAHGNFTSPCPAQADCHAGAWNMVETDAGLAECTEPYARPGTCRPSTYGTRKLARVWIVKHGDRWLWCQYPDLGSRCSDIYARHPANLPFAAVQ